MFRLHCPTCDKRLKATDDMRGKPVRCPKCGASFPVPAAAGATPALPVIAPVPAAPVLEADDSEEQPVPPSRAKPVRVVRWDEDSADPFDFPEARKRGGRDRDDEDDDIPDGKYCHECGKWIRARAAVCPKCGVRQHDEDDDDRPRMKYCFECGDRIRAKAEICPECGVRQKDAPGGFQPSSPQIAAGILAILLGGLGIHKFYLGFTGAGLVMLLVSVFTFPCYFMGFLVMSVIGLVEGVLYLTKSKKDFHRDYVVRQQAWF